MPAAHRLERQSHGGWHLEARHISLSCPPGQPLRPEQVEAATSIPPGKPLTVHHAITPTPFKKTPRQLFFPAKGRREDPAPHGGIRPWNTFPSLSWVGLSQV